MIPAMHADNKQGIPGGIWKEDQAKNARATFIFSFCPTAIIQEKTTKDPILSPLKTK
jgi:hypothetical protein